MQDWTALGMASIAQHQNNVYALIKDTPIYQAWDGMCEYWCDVGIRALLDTWYWPTTAAVEMDRWKELWAQHSICKF